MQSFLKLLNDESGATAIRVWIDRGVDRGGHRCGYGCRNVAFYDLHVSIDRFEVAPVE